MSFLKSAINQVGRDMGKAVSNQVFGDAHSTPYRRTGGNVSEKRLTAKSEFDKAISFQTGYKPSTLINKISGVYTVLKNEANYYISDGYLDANEANSLFSMMGDFNQKAEDICEVLEIDEDANEKEIAQLAKIAEKSNELFKQTLAVAAEGCENRKIEMRNEAEQIRILSFWKFVGLTTIWLHKYAKTGKHNWGITIIGNLFSIAFLFSTPPFFIYLIPALYGMFTYAGVNNKRKKLKEVCTTIADAEEKRAELYRGIAAN